VHVGLRQGFRNFCLFLRSHSKMPAKSTAQTLLEKADKKANSSGGWFSSSSTKFEEAGDLYQQAANSFKIDKLFKEAGDAFAREAECREKGGENNEAANAWWNASKAYKRGFPDCELYSLLRERT
jgi:alpha-soluble NSF attachment protein